MTSIKNDEGELNFLDENLDELLRYLLGSRNKNVMFLELRNDLFNYFYKLNGLGSRAIAEKIYSGNTSHTTINESIARGREAFLNLKFIMALLELEFENEKCPIAEIKYAEEYGYGFACDILAVRRKAK